MQRTQTRKMKPKRQSKPKGSVRWSDKQWFYYPSTFPIIHFPSEIDTSRILDPEFMEKMKSVTFTINSSDKNSASGN